MDTRQPHAVLIACLRPRLVARHDPLFVGIDGRSGVGKSTPVATVAKDFAETRDHPAQRRDTYDRRLAALTTIIPETLATSSGWTP